MALRAAARRRPQRALTRRSVTEVSRASTVFAPPPKVIDLASAPSTLGRGGRRGLERHQSTSLVPDVWYYQLVPYAVNKTTVYLPDDLKKALRRLAAASGRSEAELIRQAIRDLTGGGRRPRPQGRLWRGKDPSLSERVDEALGGFGAR